MGGLWDGRMLTVDLDEFGRLPGSIPDEAGKPFYALLHDGYSVDAAQHHEYVSPRYVPASL